MRGEEMNFRVQTTSSYHEDKRKCLTSVKDPRPLKPIDPKETIRRIRKLRWAGMDDEAERLLQELKPWPPDVEVEAVLPTRLETD